MYPKYDACYTFLDEYNLVIYPVKNKKIGMVLATSDDRKKILDLLYNTDCSDAEKRRQIGNYLDQLPLFNQEYLCMIEGCFNSKDTLLHRFYVKSLRSNHYLLPEELIL